MRWVRSSIWLICLAVMLSSPLSAQEPTQYYLSARRHFLNVSSSLTSVKEELRIVRLELQKQRQITEQNENDYNERVSALERSESRLTAQIAQLEAEKQTLAKEKENWQRDSQTLTDLRSQLASERQESDQARRRAFLKGMGWGVGVLAVLRGVVWLVRGR